VFFRSVFHILTSSLTDNGEFSLYVTELDMKKAILNFPVLVEEGFRPTSSEKELGESGFVDVFGEDANGNFVIVEIKRGLVGKEAVIQLERYVKAVKKKVNRPVRGILVAPEIQKEAQFMLATRKLEFKPLTPKKCYESLKVERKKRLDEFLAI